MFKYGKSSLDKIRTLDPRLQSILSELIEMKDNSVVWGYRGEAAQNTAYANGNSRAKFPQSAHNRMPSKAVDIIPYPNQWDASREEFMLMQGMARGIAHARGIKLKPLIEWDLAHIELED